MANISESQAREQLVQASHMLFQSGVMSHSGHGNMSFRLPETEQMLLTSGGTISNLTPDQLTVVTFDGEVIRGNSNWSHARLLACMLVSTVREKM